jgi:hypothetical protein
MSNPQRVSIVEIEQILLVNRIKVVFLQPYKE